MAMTRLAPLRKRVGSAFKCGNISGRYRGVRRDVVWVVATAPKSG